MEVLILKICVCILYFIGAFYMGYMLGQERIIKRNIEQLKKDLEDLYKNKKSL